MEQISKRELTKKCIEEISEIVRFLLEINKHPKVLENLTESERDEIFSKFAFLLRDFNRLTLSPRKEYEIQQKEKERERLEALKRSGK